VRYRFGEKIRAVRERRALTLKEVAERAGVSESLVSQIERNRVSPAIDTLLALADALDIDLEFLFADYKKERSVRVVKAAGREVFARPGVRYEKLARLDGEGETRHGIEAYLITLEPGAQTGGKDYGHPGFELGIVAEGKASLTVGGRAYELAVGDSASFAADAPHVLANAGPGQLKTYWIITPPKGDMGMGGS
jgi:transcriptional regulator with XRE-family HTH domain